MEKSIEKDETREIERILLKDLENIIKNSRDIKIISKDKELEEGKPYFMEVKTKNLTGITHIKKVLEDYSPHVQKGKEIYQYQVSIQPENFF